MGYFTLNKGKDGLFNFSLHSDAGNLLIESEDYESKDATESGIDLMRTIASFLSRFNQMRAEENQHYFLLMAANDKVIGTSGMYPTLKAMEKGIEEVMQCASLANVVDDTTV
jgi:uncharacterized protein YegP (UPF0339 family)